MTTLLPDHNAPVSKLPLIDREGGVEEEKKPEGKKEKKKKEKKEKKKAPAEG